MIPVPADAPQALQAYLMDVDTRLRALETPDKPVPVLPVSELPPAASWPSCVVRYTPLDVLAVSNGTSWIRQDTGAAIA